MRKKFNLLLAVFVAFAIISVPFVSHAINAKSGETVLWEGEVDGNFFASGMTVDVDGVIDGDVFVAGQIINIRGDVKGDVFAAGNQIVIDGNIEGDLRVAGSVIDLRGQVGKNIMGAGNSLNIASGSSVGKHITFGGNVLRVDAPVGGNIEVGVGSLILNNEIGGRIDAEVSSQGENAFVVGNNAQVKGDMNYKAFSQAKISDGAKVLGKKNYKKLNIEKEYYTNNKVDFWAKKAKAMVGFGGAVKFLSMFLIGLLLVLCLPKLVKDFDKEMRKDFWGNFGRGLLWFFIAPMAFVLLMFTLIGIPIAMIGIVFWFVGLYLAKVFSAIVIGNLIADKLGWSKFPMWLRFLFGLIIVSIVGLIPLIGWLAIWVVCMWAFGAGAKIDMELLKKYR